MNQKKLRGSIFILVLLLIVMWVVISNAPTIDAETSITPKLNSTNWNYLPYIRGLRQGPTVTATNTPTTEPYPPPETNTPSPTSTNTPSPSATNTPRPTATNTVPAPNLSAPTIHAIDNSDQDGNFTVTWTAVAGAEYYKLKQNYNDTTWDTLYEGPALSKNRSNMAPGEYCYRVRAFNSSSHSEWSADKCTTVAGEPEPEFLCEFETLYAGPRRGSDIELLHDGRLFITETSDEGASIFDPKTRRFKQIDLPQGGGENAAVLYDGRVLLTVEGDDPHSMIYDPVNDEITRLDTRVNCLGVYGNQEFGLMTYCGDNHGYSYLDVGSPSYDVYFEEYWIDIEEVYTRYEAFIGHAGEFRGYYFVPVTNGIVEAVVTLDEGFPWGSSNSFDHRDDFSPPYNVTSEKSYDSGSIYFSGGTGHYDTVKETFVSNPDGTLERLADMFQDRADHAMISLSDGNLIVLGGHEGDGYYSGETKLRDIELYVPSMDKWFKAGSLNIARSRHQAIQLLNGEIFVFSGYTDPGPGYSYSGPTEIGRCEQKN